MTIHRVLHRYSCSCVQIGAAALIAVFAWHVAAADERDPRDSAPPDHVPDTMRNIIAFEKSGAMPSRHYKIAYVTECVTNAYCEARMKGLEEAAKKYGFEFKTFELKFQSTSTAQRRAECGSAGF